MATIAENERKPFIWHMAPQTKLKWTKTFRVSTDDYVHWYEISVHFMIVGVPCNKLNAYK